MWGSPERFPGSLIRSVEVPVIHPACKQQSVRFQKSQCVWYSGRVFQDMSVCVASSRLPACGGVFSWSIPRSLQAESSLISG